LDSGAVMKLLQPGRGRDAWFLLNFALWWKEFIAGGNACLHDRNESLAAMR